MATLHLNVEFSAVTDEHGKFLRLAKLLGLADADHARGKCEHLWLACTRRGEVDLPQWLVEQVLGVDGPMALVEAELARWSGGRGDSKTRRLRISGAGKHCTWMTDKREQSSKAGKANAKVAIRRGGKFTIRPPSTDGSEPTISHHPSESVSELHLRSEEELSPARAIPPAAVPSTTEVQDPAGRSVWHDRRRWWKAMLDADTRIKASGIEPNAPAFPPNFAGENERNIAACARQLEDAGYDASTVDAKMHHIVLVSEAEAMRVGHRRWFKPALIWDPERANRAVDTSLEEARAGPARGAKQQTSNGRAIGRAEPKQPEDYREGDQKL